MEEKTIRIHQENRDLLVYKYQLFDWKIVKETKKGKRVTLVLSRDNETGYYNQLVELEKKYPDFRYLPFYWIIIFSAIAFAIITGLLITYFINSEFTAKYWFIFVIPSSLFLLGAMIFTFMRIRNVDAIINNKPKIDQEFTLKLKKIKD